MVPVKSTEYSTDLRSTNRLSEQVLNIVEKVKKFFLY